VRQLAHRLGVDLAAVHGSGKGGHVTRLDVERAAGRAAPPPAPVQAPRRVRSSPRARRIAAELGVDLSSVPGSGPAGAVVEADVRAMTAAREPQPAPARSGKDRTATMRKAIGALMARSKKSIPHYYLSATVDLRAAQDWMRSVNTGRPVTARLVPAALLLKATARAARDVPDMNGFYTDGTFRPSAPVHLGVAVALRTGGLVTPALHDADTLPLDDVMARLRDLVARARGGRLTRAEMSDPTITVTNLGDLGVESVFGVIYPPQVALVGFGRVVEQPFAEGGLLGVRPAVTVTLSADHRVSDGLRGGRFLDRIGELLQRPEDL
jgi:pyruvate dehydrogenase E2 component (dihydrolipoamide acetyltransferase)